MSKWVASVPKLARRCEGINFSFCKFLHIFIVSSDFVGMRDSVSPCSKSAPRKFLSNAMLWPTIGVCSEEVFFMKVLIWLQAFCGWTA